MRPLPTPFFAAGGFGGGSSTPFLRRDRYVAGGEVVSVTLLTAQSLEITYRTPQAVISFRHPITIGGLHPGPADQALINLLGISETMLAEIRGELRARPAATDPMIRLFQDVQRQIFIERFMGDTMDDVVSRPV